MEYEKGSLVRLKHDVEHIGVIHKAGTVFKITEGCKLTDKMCSIRSGHGTSMDLEVGKDVDIVFKVTMTL